MFTFTIILLLLIVAGWLDARLDWQSLELPTDEKKS